MNHCFDIEIAQKYGVNAAILLNNLAHWILHNKANDINFYDGYYWTYNSRKAYAELFPYMSERQIQTAFQKLIDDGLVITGKYNEKGYDHTIWYALTDKAWDVLNVNVEDAKTAENWDEIDDVAKMSNRYSKNVKSNMQKCQIDIAEMSNRYSENVKPIPNNKPNIKPDKKPDKHKGQSASRFVPPTVDDVRQYCTERGNSIDPEAFVDYYTSNGWKVGKASMKDWKAAVRTWEKKESYHKPEQPEQPKPCLDKDSPDYEFWFDPEWIAKHIGVLEG